MRKNKILILFAHPLYEKSYAHKALIKNIPNTEDVRLHDLYELYPDFNINIKYEQELLQEHDIIIWQHPMYWYSCPPLLKQWIDMVLEYNWAYGNKGNALRNKLIFQVITTGGKKENYASTGRDRYTIQDLLEPFNQTALVCKMIYLPPYVVHGTHQMQEADYEASGKSYGIFLSELLRIDIPTNQVLKYDYFNDWCEKELKLYGN
ncbi:NAD(P)H-dependent oxidoreductase [Paucihalobacter sp.]|uniref:NAD(P)H-dependent oxidoreductase n=1 Tax=Paucihalobacter sp. TaxID=2850405 RepID=UPI002FDF54B6